MLGYTGKLILTGHGDRKDAHIEPRFASLGKGLARYRVCLPYYNTYHKCLPTLLESAIAIVKPVVSFICTIPCVIYQTLSSTYRIKKIPSSCEIFQISMYSQIRW